MPLTRACTAQLRTRLDPTVDLVGVGGVASGDDAFQLILAGATAVQVELYHNMGSVSLSKSRRVPADPRRCDCGADSDDALA